MADAYVCVVGGGPAGLAAAIALRLVGQSVVVLDANFPPIDKACGEGLMPDTLEALRSLGVHIPVHEGYPFRGVRFVRGTSEVVADFPDGRALGLRRTSLHRLLVERAAELNVDLRWSQKSVRLIPDGVIAGETTVRSTLIVGADGQNSSIRRTAGLNETTRNERRYGFRRHYSIAPWTAYMELHWGRNSQLYITPISPCEIGVAVLTTDPKLRLDDALKLFPRVAERLKGVAQTSAEAGSPTTMRRLKTVTSGRVALVGDASGSVDAITGEGIGLAVRQACALANAVRRGQLASYEEAHRRIRRRPAAMAELMLLLSRFETAQNAAFGCLSCFPQIFNQLLSIHVGQNPWRRKSWLLTTPEP
ncbi:MAG: NAD(P)/FAD-dependent oxidoreductase [Acidobacteriota bacterium]|nr:NAD(P)/FAD-dependent oxidoreductase [Acidobacteriota bacterium]